AAVRLHGSYIHARSPVGARHASPPQTMRGPIEGDERSQVYAGCVNLPAASPLRTLRTTSQARRIELTAVNEDGCRPVEKHQRYHGGGEAGIGVHIGEGEFGEIATEAGAGGEPQDQRRDNSRNDLAHSAAAGGKPF